MFMATFSPCTQFTVYYYIIQPYLDRHVEPQPFALMDQGIISMKISHEPDKMTLDEAMAQSNRG